MKKILFLTFMLFSVAVFGQTVTKHKATAVANNFLNAQNHRCTAENATLYVDSVGNKLFYIVNAKPTGYVVVAADERMFPVIAWSTTSTFFESAGFYPMLEAGISNYLRHTESLSTVQKEKIENEWKSISKKSYRASKARCWPEAGSTSTEGWIETRWTQTAPYNMLCPLDPVTEGRSYAGCPAIVMGQVLNYLKTTQNTHFDDSDDYMHNYDGRVYQIDDDADSIGFPSFSDLNMILDSADAKFLRNQPITDTEAAALIFASGTACTQVYTSQGSGTFEVNQAYEGYQRFGFEHCELHTATDSAMYNTLISNLQNGFPAHLAVVDEAWSTGHNVAVDGYREDGYFHINFGWGGPSDGWWLIPDPSFPYTMGVLEGIILNIIPEATDITEFAAPATLKLYPNPASDSIHILTDWQNGQQVPYTIYSITGQQVQQGNTTGVISLNKLKSGSYILQLITKQGLQSGKFIVK